MIITHFVFEVVYLVLEFVYFVLGMMYLVLGMVYLVLVTNAFESSHVEEGGETLIIIYL